MQARHTLLSCTALLTGALFAGNSLYAEEAAKSTDQAAEAFVNSLRFSGQFASVSGNANAFQARTQIAKEGAGGIEDLLLKGQPSKDVTVQLDGHALIMSEDYLAHLRFEKDEVGSVDIGYKKFRTFYDGIGGFFPLLQGSWFPLTNQELKLDRGKFWAEATINRPNAPVISLRYIHETRDGKKDTTIWGDSNLTGLPITPANNATRKILAGFIDVDEKHQMLEARIKHVVGNTSFNVGLQGDWVDNMDSRTAPRFKYEGSTERYIVHAEGVRSGTFGVNGATETTLSDKLSISTALAYQDTHTSISGSRANAAGLYPTYDFTNMDGGSDISTYTGKLGIKYHPFATLMVEASIRGEDKSINSKGTFDRVTGTNPNWITTSYKDYSKIDERSWTPGIEVRYTGLRRVVLYTSADYRILDGTEMVATPFVPATAVANEVTDNLAEDHGKVVVGANWLQSSVFTLRGELFAKSHENKFVGTGNAVGGQYVLGYDMQGGRVTATYKPMDTVTLTARYQGQAGEMKVTRDTLAKYDSMHARNHVLAGSVAWAPVPELFIQASANLGFNSTRTAYPRAGGVANDMLRNADGDYVTTSLVARYAIGKRTDVEAEYSEYRTSNSDAIVAKVALPYGAAGKDYSSTVAVKQKVSDRLTISAKLGYFDSVDNTTGGYTNYHATLAYMMVEYKL